MWTLARRRLTDAVLVVWLVGTLAFALLHLAPGDPVTAALSDPRVSAEIRAEWRTTYGLDQPIPAQYLRYVGALARADLGFSFSQHRPVSDALLDALPNSILLMGLALLTSVILGVLLGALQATRPGTRTAASIGTLTSAFAAIPEVWLALLLLILFAAELKWFPFSGRCDPITCGTLAWWPAFTDAIRHLALPLLTLTLLLTASFARVQRSSLRDILRDDATRTARAKGVRSTQVLLHHGIRRSFGPTLTMIGLTLPAMVGGTVFVERVFGWPGMGSLLIAAIGVRDYPLVTAVATIGSLFVVLGGLLADVATAWLDPRLRAENL